MPPEQQAEWDYRYEERLGIMCEDQDPTPDQHRIAKQEADEAIRKLSERLMK